MEIEMRRGNGRRLNTSSCKIKNNDYKTRKKKQYKGCKSLHLLLHNDAHLPYFSAFNCLFSPSCLLAFNHFLVWPL